MSDHLAQRGQRALGLLVAAALWWLCVPTSRAHISLDRGSSHMSRYGDAQLKDAPCGLAGGTRGTNIYTYKPGATITISLNEYVSHPSYFRIAFDADGDDDFVEPASTAGEFGNCAGDPLCGPGMDDFCNNDAVLLDNIDPHPGAFGTTPTYTWTVTLPNIECDNCTLQIIQVMNDLNVHPAPFPGDDIYHQCIDLVLSNDAPETNVTPEPNDGIDCKAGEPTGGTGAAGTGTAGAGGAGAGAAGTGAAGTSFAGTGAAGATGGTGAAGAGIAGASAGTTGMGLSGTGAGGIGAAGAGAGGTVATPTAGSGLAGTTAAGAAAGTMSAGAAAPAAGAAAPPVGAAPPSGSKSSGCATTRGGPMRGALMLLALLLLKRWRRRS